MQPSSEHQPICGISWNRKLLPCCTCRYTIAEMEGGVNENLLSEVRRAEEEGTLKDRVWTEYQKIWIVACPAMFSRFSTLGVSIISQAFIGHIGPTELAAYALVSTVLLRFANGIQLGLSSALQTLSGQSYGANRYDMLGVYLQKSWLILVICSIVLSPVFIFTSPILIALGQDESTAQVAGTISLSFIPVLFSCMVSYTCQMFLQAQSKNMIVAYLTAFSLAIHVFISWFLTVKYKFGLRGAMFSSILAYWIPSIGQLIYLFGGWCPETWNGFSMLAFKDLWPIIKLSLSSGFMICLEVRYSTILVLVAGSMRKANISIDALSICLNISNWEMMISLGVLAASRYDQLLPALNSEFFSTKPFACEPSSLPKYPPSKELDVKRRDEEAKRLRDSSGNTQVGGTIKVPDEGSSRVVLAPEANAELETSLDRWRVVTQAIGKSKSEKFPPPHQDAEVGNPLAKSQNFPVSFGAAGSSF